MSTKAGYQAKVFINGPSTAAAGEGCSAIADDSAGRKRYQITNSLHRVLDPTQAVTVYENGLAAPAANLFRIDLLFGIITFALGHTPTAPVTADIHWLSTLALPNAYDAKLSRKNTMGDATVYAQGDAQKRRQVTLMDASIALKARGTVNDDYDPGTVGTQSIDGVVSVGTPMLVELDPDGQNAFVHRGWYVFDTEGQNVPLADLASYDLTGQAAAQGLNSLYGAGFGWGTP